MLASSALRPPRQLPHELDRPVEVVDAARRSWERRPHAAEQPYGLGASAHGSVPGGAGVSGLTVSRSLWRRCLSRTRVGLRAAVRPRHRPDVDGDTVTLGVERDRTVHDAARAQSARGVDLPTRASWAQRCFGLDESHAAMVAPVSRACRETQWRSDPGFPCWRADPRSARHRSIGRGEAALARLRNGEPEIGQLRYSIGVMWIT
jgi:hypothetical protein